jgi:phosphatidylserine/phosphatidylglycerophosphate/cardiolipin synthase-like enzyme
VVEAESRRLSDAAGDGPLGVVALDLRVARRAGLTASHHAKVLVVRGHRTGVAFCGGMDLAYTRRHSPPLIGDWQSGSAIPDPAGGWPRAGGVDYSSVAAVRPLAARQRSDLPARVYGDGRTSATRQLWHDQHLRVRGPAVVTIEDYLRERWTAAGRPRDLSAAPHGCWRSGQVLFSTPAAFDAVTGRIHPLPPPTPVAPVDGTARVQVWRTDPGTEPRADPGVEAGTELGTDPSTEAGAGAARTGAEGDRVAGTYTMMAGTAHACGSARELIWIIDQYFWSRSLARLLNRRLKEVPGLRVLLLLPPFADKQVRYQHRARALALADLVDGVGGYGDDSRVAVYDLWAPRGGPSGHGRGIYAHAKTQLYDGSLLVCGSANMNRRSFTCDTELACAVVEPAVVAGHQRRLWSWLFPGTPWPGINLDRPGGGRAFLEAVRSAVAGGSSLLIPDPWWQPSPALPGGITRPGLPFPGSFRAVYAGIIDPTSLPAGLERASGAGDAARGPADLERLSARVTAGDPAKVRSAKARSVRARSASARPGGHSRDRFRR